MQRFKIFPYLILIAIPASWGLCLWFEKIPLSTDFFPLYFGAQRLLAGLSPYGTAATLALDAHWSAVEASSGIAYPLPLLLLIIPMTLLAFPVAALLWTLVGFLSSYACVLLPPRRTVWGLLLPFAFWPFYQAVALGQATLLCFGLAVVLVFAIRRKNAWIVSVCIVLLLLKPQNGLFFAAYGAYWLWRNHKGGLLMAGFLGLLLLIASLAVAPNWIGEWMQQLSVYESVAEPRSLLPYSLGILLLCFRFPLGTWTKIAMAQVLLFPLPDLYSTLPLLLAWATVSPPLALVGAAISWLWVLLSFPSVSMAWILVIAPLLVAVLWETRPERYRKSPASRPADPFMTPSSELMRKPS